MWRFLWVSLPSELLLSCLNFRMNIQCFQGICWSVQKVRDSLFKVVGGDVLESKVKKLLGRTLLDSIDLCPGTWTHSDQLFHCVDSYESMEDFSGFPFFHGIYEGFARGWIFFFMSGANIFFPFAGDPRTSGWCLESDRWDGLMTDGSLHPKVDMNVTPTKEIQKTEHPKWNSGEFWLQSTWQQKLQSMWGVFFFGWISSSRRAKVCTRSGQNRS